jgi:hypothetical protein
MGSSVVDRHNFKCRSGYESDFLLPMPIQIWIRILPQVEIRYFCLLILFVMPLYYFFLIIVITCSILDSILKFPGKEFSLSLFLVEMATYPDQQALDGDPDQDPAKLCRSYRIRIHNTALQKGAFLIWQAVFLPSCRHVYY